MNQIALNARFYVHRPTGMQRYAVELCRHFANYLDPLTPARALRGAAGHLWEQLYLPSVLRGRLLWSPNNTGPVSVARQICTIHDLIPLEHPDWFNARFASWYGWLLPKLTNRVQHIIAVSEYTRQRLVERLKVPSHKISVIPNGVDAHFSPRNAEETQNVRRTLGIKAPGYLLCVGSLEPRKNLVRLLEAWRKIPQCVKGDVSLVVAGGIGNERVFGALTTGAAPPQTQFTGYVSDQHLPALYSGALAMVYPSLYEGFGLPPLEAMACGTPVVTSNCTSLPEVVADSAILVDPSDTASIADGMTRILGSAELRGDLRKRGLARARLFTWERSARDTLKLLLEQAGARTPQGKAA